MKYVKNSILMSVFLVTSLLSCETDDVEPMVEEETSSGGLILNEVLYDPPDGAAGDANGDGTRDPNADEFVEFVNDSSEPLDMSDYKIYDTEALTASTPRHVIPSGTVIPAGKALVVFGGGAPTGSFGGATVQTASDGRLNLNNAGDVMTLTDADGEVVVTFDVEPLSNNPNESYTRSPDLIGDFIQHGRISGTSPLYSPGTKVDGNSFE